MRRTLAGPGGRRQGLCIVTDTSSIDNPLLELVRELSGWVHANGDSEGQFDPTSRRELTRRYAWAIPNADAIGTIRAVADGRGVLEVGSGTGYWAALLREAGVDIVPTDASPPHTALGAEHNPWHPNTDCFVDVIEMDGVAAAASAGDRILLLCWPPSPSDMAYNAVQAYPGDTVVYVGEWRGVTGSGALHDMLADEWTLEQSVDIPIWARRSDKLLVFTRRDPG